MLSCVMYMTIGARGSWDFVLPFRGVKLIALIVVAIGISTSTVLFQTITRNRILTPSIMGFDALYVLILSIMVFMFGGQGVAYLPAPVLFGLNITLLLIASLLLFGTLLGQARQDLMRMILTGIVFGVLFRALTSFIQRMIDPNEYAIIQVGSYARFNQIDTSLLGFATILTIGALIAVWVMRHRLDVVALGRDAAINLGENPNRVMIQVLILVSILVSVSTTLVGPVAFFGLLVVSLAHLITPNVRHAILLPCAALVACIVLVAGQTIIERIFAFSTPLSVVVDFIGGILFLILLLRGGYR
ncbi:UNVERIFIED_CONTAM: hypothetical protein GTU68_067417 [Idotea baltica]|nr:hypothetical protein [Idotea baltica]